MTESIDYIGNIAVLRDGSSVKIVDKTGIKFVVIDLDGNRKECYYDDLSYVMEG